MRTTPNPDQLITPRTATGAAGAAATITLAADAEQAHVLFGLQAGFSSTPASARTLTVAIAGVTVFSLPVVAAGPLSVFLPQPIYGAKNEAMVISLSGDGGTAVASVNAQTG